MTLPVAAWLHYCLAAIRINKKTRANEIQSEAALNSNPISVPDILSINSNLLALAKSRGGFHGVVLNPPWKEPCPGTVLATGIVPEDLAKLPLGNLEFLPAGFVYVWTPKHLLLRTLVVLEKVSLFFFAFCAAHLQHSD